MNRRPVLRRNEQHFLAARRAAQMARQARMARQVHEIGDLVHGDKGDVLMVTAVFPGEVVLRRLALDARQRPEFGMYDGPPVRRLMTEA